MDATIVAGTREVEDVLHEHNAVREAVVVGIPHARLGEEVAAAVVVDRNAGDVKKDVAQPICLRCFQKLLGDG